MKSPKTDISQGMLTDQWLNSIPNLGTRSTPRSINKPNTQMLNFSGHHFINIPRTDFSPTLPTTQG